MTNIRAVSKLAGVSVATVSRALQKPDMVSEATREKVKKAVEEAGYKPNMMARNFRSKKSFSIMVLVPDVSNPFFGRVISAIQHEARARKYNVILGNTMGKIDLERELAHMLLTNQADGIIQLSSRYPLRDEDRAAAKTLPIVNCCECVDDDSMPTIQLDNSGAATALTDHLIGLGHKRIGVIAGPEESPLTIARLNGHTQALEAHGIGADQGLVMAGDYSLASGKAAAEKLLALDDRPSAIFCCNDEMAMGALHAIRKAGLKVPEDISVTGFDDLEFASYTSPALTTVSQPSTEFGAHAIATLFEMMAGDKTQNRHLVLPFELIIRGSTGPAPT
ncbi:LacI family DNA-binding transcriptional regulator [Kordiimonas sp.]|uniref:LacI family DNA-binding transcriptional regulator n=1 Tax=Kordiimonas sp. TaxID=1970157 RepID=UPI003A945EA1